MTECLLIKPNIFWIAEKKKPLHSTHLKNEDKNEKTQGTVYSPLMEPLMMSSVSRSSNNCSSCSLFKLPKSTLVTSPDICDKGWGSENRISKSRNAQQIRKMRCLMRSNWLHEHRSQYSRHSYNGKNNITVSLWSSCHDVCPQNRRSMNACSMRVCTRKVKRT